MSDEKKDKPEETEKEVKDETSEPAEEEVEESGESSDASSASEASDASSASEASDASRDEESEGDEAEESLGDELSDAADEIAAAVSDAMGEDSEDSDASEASEPSDADDDDAVPAAVAAAAATPKTEELDRADVETIDHVRDGHSDVLGIAAFFDHPDHLLYAAEQAREADFEDYDAYSPFPIHGMDDAMGLGRSWIPWVTFCAGLTGFTTASMIEFGIMGYDWPMVFGGKPFIAWPSFVPVMFELTVLFAGVTTAIVMLVAAGCFRKPFIIDPEITNDRFVLWISANDPSFDHVGVIDFMKKLNPMEIRTLKKDAKS